MTRKGWILFTAMSVIWGIPYLFIKIAVQELDPTVVVFIRVGIAALVLLPISLQQKVLHTLRRRWLIVAALACIQIVGPFLLISYGEEHITSSLTSLLIAADPLMIVLFALRFDPGERVNRLRLLGLLVGMAGVVILLGLNIGGDEQRVLGAGLILLATAAYAISALLIKRPIIATLPSLAVVTAECITTTILLLPLAVTRLPTRFPDLQVLISLLILGLICTALAYVLFFALVGEIGASRAAVITYVNPAVSVLLGVILLGEPLNTSIVLGFLLIILGSCLSTGSVFPVATKRVAPAMDRQEIGSEFDVHRQDTPVEH
jgi:drug/metabolite transporter (DMT)-like permease